jgi:hypothetical protein
VVFASDPEQLLLLIVMADLLAGTAAGAARLATWLKAALFLAAPVAALASYHVINPDPGCAYDCQGKLGWTLLLIFGVGAWWIGLALGILSRWLIKQRGSSRRDRPVS